MEIKPNWYYQLKFSRIGRLYTYIKHPGLRKQSADAVNYYAMVLPQGKNLVFDIGANVGDLSAVFLSMGNRVVAIEPDPVNFNILTARFMQQPAIALLPVAVAGNSGTGSVFLSAVHGRSLSTLSEKRKLELEGTIDEEGPIVFDSAIKISTTTLDSLISQFGLPAFIKIDVEGYESEVLQGLSQPVPLLSFEANLPSFFEETQQCLEKLLALDQMASFNCSTNDSSLVFHAFQPGTEFKEWLARQTFTYLEIFCKMSC